MVRFIRMWLVLRTLRHQEEWIMCAGNFGQEYLQGTSRHIEKPAFIQVCSNFNLWIAFLPRILRWKLNPVKIQDVRPPNSRRVIGLDSVIRDAEARGFIEDPKNSSRFGKKLVDDSKQSIEHITVSPKGDGFITWLGGFQALLSEFPKAWVFLIVSLPPWIPWIIRHASSIICSIHQFC